MSAPITLNREATNVGEGKCNNVKLIEVIDKRRKILLVIIDAQAEWPIFGIWPLLYKPPVRRQHACSFRYMKIIIPLKAHCAEGN